MYDYIIVGGGIVGLSVAMALSDKFPGTKLAIIEKEEKLASHQTGHNSGVIHSGIYYTPGSLKARLAKEGNESMVAFCELHQIPYEQCGKVIVATSESERLLLDNLYQKGIRNGLQIRKINRNELLELEPHVQGLEAIHVPMAGIVNYQSVCEVIGNIIRNRGGKIFLNSEAKEINELENEVIVETNHQVLRGGMLINCAGLQSDRIAKLTGYKLDMKIVPFRGEYYQLAPNKKHLVKNLIYPVPNPNFPFLGVHFTRMIDGTIDVGPNAVLNLDREGYKKVSFKLQDAAETLTYLGFWKLASTYMKEGINEMVRSFYKKKFVESVQILIPSIEGKDLIPGPTGIRAQALREDGTLVDDFYIINGKRSVHVCNAPSPAATASIEIGKEVVKMLSTYKVTT
ncbi:L-2-hydroxyglutarate oxidase [Heyndrickxia sporothermodurans]|uniref:L-2-hydroxyglutarate oxidase n=1 Tax=Heyndrickxia sporothermodurans TaxID=46224 RepID=UPI002E233CC9|nr:L-2-hydroxyglutarate oxidase [Heyndrickxia sporothermodurans]MED3655986.1 L-2-hydroxyglutarate oxidase [Heyndrickxia sporothermodurans]